ncbi:2Fe-2S ferredoxin [Plesiocystis pacifica SIR-1]|uniref:2Fe-2S ferredoxin n=2 Tax=Plesiocystis pacifica TaxID=191768 RepID=A6G0X7_9BACT|nr:2Fe-2S ferredoxin [Plesiocystis pacifica SIR-1]
MGRRERGGSPSEGEGAGEGLTRRGLFRRLGVAGTAAALVNSSCKVQDGELEAPAVDLGPDTSGAFGLDAAPLNFTLDGKAVDTKAEARTTLLELLRLDLDATGTKVVCDRGACGACMVLVDGVARNSCMLLAHDVAGAEVTTVAGLGASGELSALQQAFVDHDALQCGFCTSGMLISASALLRKGGGPGKAAGMTAAQVEDGLAGNLCRCGTYPHVVAAVLSVAKGERVDRVPTERIALGEDGSKPARAQKGGAA